MFTGIIEEIGTMRRITKQGSTMMLTVECRKVLEDVKLGDSIAVNGVCLTVVGYDASGFTADVMPETFRKTNLSQLRTGESVNLERAMAANGRFGGHIVQGHIDTTGTIAARTTEENAVVFDLEPNDASLFRYLLPHGSITLDGISLTIVKAEQPYVRVSIIPHTLAQTVLQHKKPGDTVNMEADVIGKYVHHLLGFKDTGSTGPASGSKISLAFLAEHGFVD